jgi:hypothetical protein
MENVQSVTTWKKGNEPKKQRSRILHTWRWSCRKKHVVKYSGNQHTIKLHADGNITCNAHSFCKMLGVWVHRRYRARHFRKWHSDSWWSTQHCSWISYIFRALLLYWLKDSVARTLDRSIRSSEN